MLNKGDKKGGGMELPTGGGESTNPENMEVLYASVR